MAIAKLQKDHNFKCYDCQIVGQMDPRANPALKRDHYGWDGEYSGRRSNSSMSIGKERVPSPNLLFFFVSFAHPTFGWRNEFPTLGHPQRLTNHPTTGGTSFLSRKRLRHSLSQRHSLWRHLDGDLVRTIRVKPNTMERMNERFIINVITANLEGF
ncbi:hypothetical protein PIB30_043386 [Stylosanthes scabra]|uniref:Uncharacterized protein n=1 Tax=Stylosanthes scabra TaxID=79078 RepID=A0ABU6ZE89_9FABA|nr:hypothetical protein [Stylosanthes scabra]